MFTNSYALLEEEMTRSGCGMEDVTINDLFYLGVTTKAQLNRVVNLQYNKHYTIK